MAAKPAPITVDMLQTFKDLKGHPIPVMVDRDTPERDADGFVVRETLRGICQNALLGVIADLDQKADGKTKVKLYALAMKIGADDCPPLNLDDIVLIKERIGRMYPPIIVGQAFAMFPE